MTTAICLRQHEVIGILSGRQSQFRRIVKDGELGISEGDLLWVCESFRYEVDRVTGRRSVRYLADDVAVEFPDAIFQKRSLGWHPSATMPRWASRITIEVMSVRVERLQDISEADAIAEAATGGRGVIPFCPYAANPVEHYRRLWNRIHGDQSWSWNPWVRAVEFKRIQ